MILFSPHRSFEATELEEGEGEHRHERMAMKSLPGSPFEVVEPKLLFQLLMGLLANPTCLDGGSQSAQIGRSRQIDTRKGEQHKLEYLAINPNAKVPAIVDGDVTVFDSNAILLYLAEKTGKFLPPKSDKLHGELLSWLMFVASGVGPYSGQSVHFRAYAPDKIDYALNRASSLQRPKQHGSQPITFLRLL